MSTTVEVIKPEVEATERTYPYWAETVMGSIVLLKKKDKGVVIDPYSKESGWKTGETISGAEEITTPLPPGTVIKITIG